MTFTTDPPTIESLELIPDYKQVIAQEAGSDATVYDASIFPGVFG